MPKLSIAVPIYDMENKIGFLERLFNSLVRQTFRDFEVIIADNSERISYYKYPTLNIRHFYNPNKGMAKNTNFAIEKSDGELIKVLYMDDWLAHENALKDIVENFSDTWMITGTSTNPHPYWTDDIHLGNNKLGSPSALTIKNESPLLFDETLGWLLDCDLYRRLYDSFGPPTILDSVNVNLGIGTHQQTNILSDDEKLLEHKYMYEKYTTI